jgi:hypothetical protein
MFTVGACGQLEGCGVITRWLVLCRGGHGRTGTVVSIMLGLLYGLPPFEAMRWVQFCHDLRVAPMGTPSPQTEAQRQQVVRILNAVRSMAAGTATNARAGKAVTASGSNLSPQVCLVITSNHRHQL